MRLREASFCLVQLRYSKEMQRATRWLRRNNFRLSCTATAMVTSSIARSLGSQPFAVKESVGPVGRLFWPRTTRAAVPETNIKGL